MGAASGHTSLITPDGKNLKLAASTGPLSKLVARALPREGSMAGWAIEQGKPLVINDLTADPRAYGAGHGSTFWFLLRWRVRCAWDWPARSESLSLTP